MEPEIIRRAEPVSSLGVRGIGRRADGVYVLVENGAPLWQAAIDWGEARSRPFREEAIWQKAKVAIVGGGADVYFFDLKSGDLRLHAAVPSYFGHLAIEKDLAFILGCSDVLAYDASLTLRWRAEDVAIDGITFRGVEGERLLLSAEMDPPGGWRDVALDLETGRRLE